jgi:DNA-directed RNA polymerase specialized sigma24 family protein
VFSAISSFWTIRDSAEPSPDAEEMLLISHNRDEVRRALEQLPKFREAIVPRELKGLS